MKPKYPNQRNPIVQLWRHSIIVHGALRPWNTAVYFRSKAVQWGAIIRTIIITSLIATTCILGLDVNAITEPGPQGFEEGLKNLTPEQMAKLLIFALSLSLALTTVFFGILLYLLGRIIEVPYLSLRKSVAITGWALVCIQVLMLPLGFIFELFLPESIRIGPSVQIALTAVYIGMGWYRAGRAHLAQVITLGVFFALVTGVVYFVMAS